MLKIKLYQSVPYSCPYIPSNIAHHYTTDPNLLLSAPIYSSLIEMGFRRAGERIHRPNCKTCDQCVSLRIPVSQFTPNKSQRRVINKNQDLTSWVVKSPRHEDYIDLYEQYITSKHPESEGMQEAEDTFDNFLFSRWSEAFAIEYREPSNQLVCVSICDPVEHGWSAVYTFYDLEYAQRSLGTFSILTQIELLKDRKLDYLYLGYWIRDCKKMNYKTNFKPCEGFINEQWVTINDQ